jgi:hypothetical protein
MSVIERLILLLIGMLVGCSLTLVVLGLPLLGGQPALARTYVTAASIVGFIALGGSIAWGAIKLKRPPKSPLRPSETPRTPRD